MGDLDALLTTASSTLGLVHRRTAGDLGFDDRHLRALRRAGHLDEPYPGVVRFAAAPRSHAQDVLAACLSLGDDAVASYRTATGLWGLRGFSASCIDVSVRRRSPVRRRGVTVHRHPGMGDDHVTRLGPVPVTTPARTVVDLADFGLARLVRRAIDEWSARRVLRVGDLVATLASTPSRGRPGPALVRAILDQRAVGVADVDSAAEAELADILVAHGLGRPVYHHLLRVDGTVLAEFDLAYPQERLAIEVVGLGPHGTPEQLAADMVRRNQIALAGWRLLEFEPARLGRPGDVAATVRAMLGRPPEHMALAASTVRA